MATVEQIDALVAKSREAQKVIETYSQEKIDEIVKMFAKVIFDNAEMFAKMAVEETRMGVYENKVAKNLGKARILWNHLKGKKTRGIINYLEDEGLVEVAKPMGVVCAATPCTNPIVTPMCNAMFAVKGGNTIIIAPHPRAVKCTAKIKELYDAELTKMGVPTDIFMILDIESVDDTINLMQRCDVVLATGGAGMVKSAYSSGKPSYGVGPGNVQGIVDEDVDFNEAAQKMIASRTFDNGIICSGDQTIIAPATKYNEVIDAFKANGAYYVDDAAEVAKFRDAIFPGGVMNKNLVGQGVQDIANAAGVDVPEDTKVIIIKPGAYGKEEVFSKEKMCPVMTAYEWNTWEEAVAIAKANLLYEGAGHSVSIQSNNKEHVEYAAVELPVSRILINQICATQNGGAFTNSLNPTTTLGCGSWGNNAVSENITYYHLFNKSRIAYVKPGYTGQPSDEEIWG